MNVNVTEIFDDNMTLLNNNNNNDSFITIEITPIYLIIAALPCALSIICCLSFLSYGFIKVLIDKR